MEYNITSTHRASNFFKALKETIRSIFVSFFPKLFRNFFAKKCFKPQGNHFTIHLMFPKYQAISAFFVFKAFCHSFDSFQTSSPFHSFFCYVSPKGNLFWSKAFYSKSFGSNTFSKYLCFVVSKLKEQFSVLKNMCETSTLFPFSTIIKVSLDNIFNQMWMSKC